MPEHCGGGNTCVFVNGRELNQKDLNLLGSRGLPTERDRSYIVEISGRVLDEDTGEEMESLGKLAPTLVSILLNSLSCYSFHSRIKDKSLRNFFDSVERLKHGFGMRAPKPVA